jgi:uncharacterized protein
MSKKYIFILIIFFLLTGPGPSVLFLNKFTVSFFPIISLITTLFLLKDELLQYNLNHLLKKEHFKDAWIGIQVGVYAHAACALLLPAEENLTNQLLVTYAVMAVNVVFFGPIIEEIVYRKILFGFLNIKFGFWPAAVCSSLIFALGHFSVQRVLAYFIVGMIFCYISSKNSSNVPNTYAHIALNYAALVAQTIK